MKWLIAVLFFFVIAQGLGLCILADEVDRRQDRIAVFAGYQGARTDTLYAWLAEVDLELAELEGEVNDLRHELAVARSEADAAVQQAHGNQAVIAAWIGKPPWKSEIRAHAAAINWLLRRVQALENE